MRHRKKGFTLDRKAGPRRSLMVLLAQGLIRSGRMQTTRAKAKAVQPFVERCITIAKKPTIAHQRLLFSRLGGNREIVGKLLKVIAPRFGTRHGGYTRITPLAQRKGDGAKMALIELIE